MSDQYADIPGREKRCTSLYSSASTTVRTTMEECIRIIIYVHRFLFYVLVLVVVDGGGVVVTIMATYCLIGNVTR